MEGATATLTPPSQNDFLADADDDGPFFDLQLDQNDDDDTDDDDNNNDSASDSDSENEFKLTLSPSPNRSQPNSNPHFTASLLKSATKFRVFMLGLKKPRPNAAPAPPPPPPPPPAPNMKPRQRKLFTVKFKVEEVPIVSFFNSSRSKAPHNQNTASETETVSSFASASASASEDKRIVRKYLKKVYVRVSRSYSEMLRISDPVDVLTSPVPTEEEEDSETANVEGRKQGNVPLPAGLRKHFSKGRSAVDVAVAAPPLASSKRRDDSLLQQQDWIQGAILHCKTSFNASTECETSQLPQSVNKPLPDKYTNEKCL